MTYTKAITLDKFSYTPSNFKTFNALEKSYNSVKNTLKNTYNYITEIVFPENIYGKVIVDKNNRVHDNLHKENVNARGHLIHLTDREKEIYSQKEVKEFIQYLKSKGKKVADITGYEAVNTKGSGMIAGVHADPFIFNAIPTISTDYFLNVAFEARHNETSAEITKLYIALHEISHTIRNPKNVFYNIIYNKYPYLSEKYVEKTVYAYAIKKAKEATTKEEKDKWLKIAEIAEDRYKNVKEIYKKRRLSKADKKENLEKKVENEKVENKEDSKEKYEKEDYQEKAEENIEANSEEVNPDSKSLDDVVGEGSETESCESSASE